jgi:hypothetical protein
VATQIVNLKAAGLQTYFQTLMEISPGALLKANNTVINRDGVIEPRRGIKAYGSSFGTSSDRCKQLLEYKGRIIRHVGNKLAYDDGTSVFTNFSGNYLEPISGFRIKSSEAKSNFYFTTNEGVKKISARSAADLSITNVIEDAGGPKAIAGSLSLNGTSGFLLHNNSVAYRILWTYTDRNQNLIFGAPSASMEIENTVGGTKNVQLDFQIPYNVTSTDFKYRIYRSEMSASGTPSDELYQVYEGNPTAGELTAKQISVVDSLDESLRLGGVPLYTNQYSGEGILKSNEPPPAARDISLFKGHMFYANTRTRHSSQFTILDLSSFVAGTSTFVIGTTTPVSSFTYTFNATENIATRTVQLDPASIENTAKSLVRVINGNGSEIVTAYYLSVFGETPGKILLQRKTLVDTSFYIGTTHSAIATAFTPELGTGGTLTTKVLSTTEAIGNRLYYSKYQEVEAVPLLNYIDIGSRDQEISRIISLRESLFVFKGDGVYRLAGDPGVNPIWDIGAFDLTSIIKAPDTATTLANNCYYFSNQGIIKLNESTLESISRPIEDKLIPFISTNPNLDNASFAVGYESDRALLVWTVLTKNDTTATVCYRYSVVTNSWTEWKIAKTCAVLNSHEDKLYFGSGVDNYVEIERKNFNRFDSADRELPLSFSSSGLSGNVIKPSGFFLISLEDVLLQEQYVTIHQYNTLLRHLDLDNGLLVRNFYNELKMVAGDNLTFKMSQLVAKLNIADPTTNYSLLWTNPAAFNTIQAEFNTIITALNASSGAILTNYVQSTGTIKYEAIVTALDSIRQEVTLNAVPPFMVGPLTLYKGIKTEIEYAPQHAGDPASFKQYSVGTFMFERRSFYTAQTAYKSDISDSYEEISFKPNSAGTFGTNTWGDSSAFGGQGDQGQIRTYIPLKKQRCRFLGCKFMHGVALESYQLYGLALSVRQYSIPDRNYK